MRRTSPFGRRHGHGEGHRDEQADARVSHHGEGHEVAPGEAPARARRRPRRGRRRARRRSGVEVQARRRMRGPLELDGPLDERRARARSVRSVHVHDHAAEEGERAAIGRVEGAEDLATPTRDQEDEEGQQRQQRVVGDGRGAVGPVVVQEAIERAPGEPRGRWPDHTRFCGRAGRISTRLRWAPSRARSRSRTARATSSAVQHPRRVAARAAAAEARCPPSPGRWS